MYIIYGVFGGPALALSYGLGNFSPLYCFTLLTITYIASVMLVHVLLSRVGLRYRFRNKIFSKASSELRQRGEEIAVKVDELAGRFRKELGGLGFYLALVSFTFLFGVYWAGLAAFILGVDLWGTVLSIGTGAVLSVAFWTYVMSKHSLDPVTVTLFFMCLTVAFMVYGLIKENKTISSISSGITSKIEKMI